MYFTKAYGLIPFCPHKMSPRIGTRFPICKLFAVGSNPEYTALTNIFGWLKFVSKGRESIKITQKLGIKVSGQQKAA